MLMAEYGGAHFDRRQFPRLDATLPCAFEYTDENVPEGVTTNVSLGGLLVYLPHDTVAGQIIDIKMKLPTSGGDNIFKAKAEVMWVQAGNFPDGWSCQAGLRFLEMSPASLEVWKNFLTAWYDK
jgi:c-di-GMP-binding flagellar brake protein YcgR